MTVNLCWATAEFPSCHLYFIPIRSSDRLSTEDNYHGDKDEAIADCCNIGIGNRVTIPLHRKNATPQH
ncbi:MAG: hypothetical protein WBB29_04465 [Geitlerinemataceae cyanobacterium]